MAVFLFCGMNKYIAEYLGTFALVFCGTGAIIVDQISDGAVGLFGIAAAFGLVICSVIYMFGHISGAHINPAVTATLAINRMMPQADVIPYIIAQMLGAISASATLVFMFPNATTLGATSPSGSFGQSFFMELIITFLLMLTILGVSTRKETSHLSGLIIGFAVFGFIFVAGPVSGGSFNPARSIGPALFGEEFSNLWLYIVSPTLGSILAGITWKMISMPVAE